MLRLFSFGSLFAILVSLSISFFGCTMKKADQKLIITAHRGASGWAPENTLAAFKKAIDMGSDYSELDVHLSKDGEVVLLHDSELDRTTDGEGGMWNYTLAELKKLDAGSWFSAEFAGEPLPTLREVIRAVKGKMKLNIEIKISGNEPDIAEKVVEIVRAENFIDECMITSFDKAAVVRCKKIAPEIKTGFIFNEKNTEDYLNGSWEILSCKYTVVNQDFVNGARKAGKLIHVWTVNEKDMMKKIIAFGVDGIITNYPDRLHEVLKEM